MIRCPSSKTWCVTKNVLVSSLYKSYQKNDKYSAFHLYFKVKWWRAGNNQTHFCSSSSLPWHLLRSLLYRSRVSYTTHVLGAQLQRLLRMKMAHQMHSTKTKWKFKKCMKNEHKIKILCSLNLCVFSFRKYETLDSNLDAANTGSAPVYQALNHKA